MTQAWQAAPLHWGQGATSFEIFIEPTCPFSVNAQGKLNELLQTVGPAEITVKLRLHSQPWHLHSPVVIRCVAAASTLPDGRDKAWAVLAAVGEHRPEFVCEDHATGPNRQASPEDIIERVQHYSGVDLKAAFAISDLDSVVKWHARYARQNGIHSSPSFMINGMLQPQISSGDSVTDWAQAIRQASNY